MLTRLIRIYLAVRTDDYDSIWASVDAIVNNDTIIKTMD